jgi:hypothetical protein
LQYPDSERLEARPEDMKGRKEKNRIFEQRCPPRPRAAEYPAVEGSPTYLGEAACRPPVGSRPRIVRRYYGRFYNPGTNVAENDPLMLSVLTLLLTSVSNTFVYETLASTMLWPDGQEKLPGPGAFKVMLPVTFPF